MPPRHGKSELTTRLFSAYWLYLYPHEWVSINAYGSHLAEGMSRKARDFYGESGGKLRHDSKSVAHWETGQGGGLFAAGVGGPILGKGYNLGIIDDPTKNQEDAASEAMRETLREWYLSTFLTREEPSNDDDPDGAIIVIQQRWRDDDMSGWQLEQEEQEDDPEDAENWHVVNFEAIKEDSEFPIPPTCTLEPDWRQPGEALCPERRPIHKLERIRKRLGDYFFFALYQQRPRPREGMAFKEHYFKKVGAYPAISEWVRYWDLSAADPGKGDYTAGVLLGRCPNKLIWIVDVRAGQWGKFERNEIILQTAQDDKSMYGTIPTHIELGIGVAKEVAEDIVRMLQGFDAHVDPVKGKKEDRAVPFQAQCEAGNVRMVEAPWNRRYLQVMCSFPYGKHDDEVDATSSGFSKLAAKPKAKPSAAEKQYRAVALNEFQVH